MLLNLAVIDQQEFVIHLFYNFVPAQRLQDVKS